MKKLLAILSLFLSIQSFAQTVEKRAGFYDNGNLGKIYYDTVYTLPHKPLFYFNAYGNFVSLSDTVRSLFSVAKSPLSYNSSTGQFDFDTTTHHSYAFYQTVFGSGGGSSLWAANGSNIYRLSKVGIKVDTPSSALTVMGANLGNNELLVPDSSGLLLGNVTSSTSTVAQASAPLIFATKGNGTTTSTTHTFRMLAVANNSGTANLYIQDSINGAAYKNIILINPSGGIKANYVSNSSNFSVLSAASLSSNTTVQASYGGSGAFNFGGDAFYADGTMAASSTNVANHTINWFNAKPTLNNVGGILNISRGYYYNPTVTNDVHTKSIGFENTIGDNRLNSTSGGTSVGDTLIPSAKFSVSDTTKGFLLPRMTKTQRNKIISSITGSITNAGSGYNLPGIRSFALTGGSGSGAKADITVASGSVTLVEIKEVGSGYQIGDVLSASLPGGSGFEFTISDVGAPADGLMVIITGETGGSYLSYYNAEEATWEKVTATAD